MDNKPKRLRLVAYTRVSSNAQAERDTIAVQRREVRQWAKHHGHRIVRWCEDEALTGALDVSHRPGLSCALSAVESGEAEGVITWTLFRLARDLTVQEATLALFWRARARVFTTDQGEIHPDDPSDPMRTAMRQMMGVFGQLERAMIRRQMEAGRAAKAERGGYTGGRPGFGHRADAGKLIVDETEATTVRRILELRKAGLSYRGIVTTLDAEGRTTKQGCAWLPGTVRRVCLRELNDAGDNRRA